MEQFQLLVRSFVGTMDAVTKSAAVELVHSIANARLMNWNQMHATRNTHYTLRPTRGLKHGTDIRQGSKRTDC